ncbi:MAG: hypothetical protein ACRC7N_03085 [Clostridium sp.]
MLNDLLNINTKLEDIPHIFDLLLSSDEKTKFKAAEILNVLINSLNSKQLVRMDKIFRGRTSYDWNYDRRNKEPRNILDPLMSKEEKIAILGLSSFHPNGYFREKSILALSHMNSGYAIPYLLIRLNDWVREVRSASKSELLKYIRLEYVTDFINNLPLVLRLIGCSRDEHGDVIEKIIELVSSTEGRKKLICGLESSDAKVRLACYKIIIKKGVMDNKSIIKHLFNDKDSFNRIFVIRSIKDEITEGEAKEISQLMIKDRNAQIRVIGLEMMYNFSLGEALGVLEESIFDKNKSVRELSRYLLLKNRKYDFSSMYRESIERGVNIYGSIYGLGETGNKKDSSIIASFMEHDAIKIVKASIVALSMLDMEVYKNKIIMSLKDSRVGISKVARRVLIKEIHGGDGVCIYDIYSSAVYDHVRINACILLCSLGKWRSIKYIIEFCGDKNGMVSQFGAGELEKWILKYNRSFVVPSSSEVKALRDALVGYRDFIGESEWKFIEFCIRDY